LKEWKCLKYIHKQLKNFNVSEHGGILFWLDDEQQEMVKIFEEKYNAVVYHVIHNYTKFGELYSLLYVSQHEQEWDYDRDDIKHNIALSYVVNINEESFSEFGSIGIKPQYGGVIRIN